MCNILAASTLILLFVQMFKCSKNTLLKEQNFVKENRESFAISRNILSSTWNLQNQLIIQQSCVEAAFIL